MKKVFLDIPLELGSEIVLSGPQFKHVKALRLHSGDQILLGTNDSQEYLSTIISFSKTSVVLSIEKEITDTVYPLRKIHLYISLPKKEKLEDIIYMCSQLGVVEIHPFISSRSIKRPSLESFEKQKTRYLKKAIQGAELSGSPYFSTISELQTFDEALKDFSSKALGTGLLFWEEEHSSNNLKTQDLSDSMAVFIGPEGGFSEFEIELAKKHGLIIRSLGNLVIAVETAAVSSIALLLCQ